MSCGGSRVSIPDNIRKTIQGIKEVAGKHSDDDIYTMLKECNMDPDETTQRLSYLDTFHLVKRKRERKKVNVNGRYYEESRWTTGTQGRGVMGGSGNYSSYSDTHGAGNVGAQNENGVINHMERRFRSPPTVVHKTEPNPNPRVSNYSGIPGNRSTKTSKVGSSHERRPQSELGAGCPAGNRSTESSDAANNTQAALGDVTSAKILLKESQVVEKNQPLEPPQPVTLATSYGSLEVVSVRDGPSPQSISPSKVIAYEAATLAVETGSQSLLQQSVSDLEEATSKFDMKLEKLNITAYQPVIFPDHLHVPEDFKNGLIFGSLDACSEESIECHIAVDGPPDDGKISVPITELLLRSDQIAREISPSNVSESSTDRDGDYADNPDSLALVPDNSSHLDGNVSSDAAPRHQQSKQAIMMLPQGGPLYPFAHNVPNYSFPFIQPMLGSQLVKCEGPDPQGGDLLVSSTSGSTPTANQPAGVEQSSIAVSPPPFSLLQQPFPPNYYPFGSYWLPYYWPSNAIQFVGHSGFPQQPSTGNVYLPLATTSPVPQGRLEINPGNATEFGVLSGYGSYSPSLPVTCGNSAGNEDHESSELKESSVYTTVQQGEGPLVWLPAFGLHPNSFYNHLPQGQHVAFSPSQAGHGPFPGVYHADPKLAATPIAHSLLQESRAMVESVGQPHNVIDCNSK